MSGFPLGTTHGNPGAFVEVVSYLLPQGVGENIAFVHRACNPGGRPWGFAGQRYTPLTIPRCCLRCSLHAVVAWDLGLELTKFCGQVSILRSPILGSTQSPNFMHIPRTHSAQKPYILRSLSPIDFGHFFPFLERKRKERKKLYLPRVNYIITGNPVVNITALKTLKESLKKYTQYNYLVKWSQLHWNTTNFKWGSKRSK